MPWVSWPKRMHSVGKEKKVKVKKVLIDDLDDVIINSEKYLLLNVTFMDLLFFVFVNSKRAWCSYFPFC